MAEDERLYTVPLRMAKRVPRTKRAERAVSEVKDYIARHMKQPAKNVWLDQPVNEALWSRGRQKPPTRIRVRAIKFDDGVVEVSLPEDEGGSKREQQAEERAKAKEEAAPKKKEEKAEERAAEEKPAEVEKKPPAAE